MDVHTTVADFQAARRRRSGSLGLVPTMGYLHRGHLALVRLAREENDLLAVSIFVNPAQFGPSEDYEAYPRDMDRDLDLLRRERVDYVFAPGVEEMYPPGHDTWIDPGDLGTRLEGAHRPGHFRGVATVVAKLFNVVAPDRAYFGQKDGQQVAVVRRMVSHLGMGVDIVAVPTVREEDGLALSSRNVYLTPEQREAAPAVFRALLAAERLWSRGERDGDVLRGAVRIVLEETPLIEAVDYVSVAGTPGLAELDRVTGPAMVSVAVRMGRARLIDNLVLDPASLPGSH
ncbi:MAG: pantoate--beta-alanine ligase [Dehalococcoidia bacterium]|nr:pantoate--beta-alanine ligase [Dehalococcoidia bacterium]